MVIYVKYIGQFLICVLYNVTYHHITVLLLLPFLSLMSEIYTLPHLNHASHRIGHTMTTP